MTTVTNNSPAAINTSLFDLEKQLKAEINEIRNIVKSINDEIGDINASETVVSVNGKSGIVKLNANDVGALPEDTKIPNDTAQLGNSAGFITIDDVQGYYVPVSRKVNDKELRTDISLVASDVGALPDDTTHLSGDIAVTEKAEANGVATLDEYGKVPVSQLPSAIMQYKGAWDASTNTPQLQDGMTGAIQGDVYVCNKAGTANLGHGSIEFVEGDWVMYNGSIWERSANANLVKSVNGKQGVVKLTASDVGALPTTGGVMTGTIQYKGTKATTNAIQFIDNTVDEYGNGIVIGAGGLTIIGGGEAATAYKNGTSETVNTENMVVCNDADVNIVTNLQAGYSSRKTFKFGRNGTLTMPNGAKTVKYVDYKYSGTLSNVYEQARIELTSFGSNINYQNVISFQVIYWTGFQAFANGDWGNGAGGSGLACALTCLKPGNGYAIIRCAYLE